MIYLDMDGVVADFDLAAANRLGMSVSEYEHTYGHHSAWPKLHPVSEFFRGLPLIPDARVLVEGVGPYGPVKFLTALPSTDRSQVEVAKIEWLWEHFPGYGVIACDKDEKANYCQERDVLIDDQTFNRKRWQDRGGIFIQHRNAVQSLRMLKHWLGAPRD